MREFNKLFVISLPRCATVSTWSALGKLGIPTAHLGLIYGESSTNHYHRPRFLKMAEQAMRGDYQFEILEKCRGLVDYPACCPTVLRQLDTLFPNSIYINVRRDYAIDAWLRSVERQFVGLQLLHQQMSSSSEEREFMRCMMYFRAMTFGQSQYNESVFRAAYQRYQEDIDAFTSARPNDCLSIEDLTLLADTGYERLCAFLECETTEDAFPYDNAHSLKPAMAFEQAVTAGQVGQR